MEQRTVFLGLLWRSAFFLSALLLLLACLYAAAQVFAVLSEGVRV